MDLSDLSVTREHALLALEEVIEKFRTRVENLRRIARQNRGKNYYYIKHGQAEELEQSIYELEKITTWMKLRIELPPKEERDPLYYGPLFKQKKLITLEVEKDE